MGFFAAGEQKVFSDTINEKFNESQEYNWTLQNLPAAQSQLISAKLSGSITGNAKVYLVTDSGKLLIFDSSSLKTGLSPLTAFAAASETAQPGPPSSGESSSPEESQPIPADTTSGPGAESPPPASAPAENVTTPENITTPENVTTPENATIENITVPENVTGNATIPEEIPLVEIPFETACVDTCYISEILNKSSYILQIELDSNAVLKLDTITYELFIPKENLTNITNETVFFATDVKDSSNNTIAATIEFVDPNTQQVEAIGQSEQAFAKAAEPVAAAPIFQAAAVAEEQPGQTGLEIPKGKYEIKVKPQNMPITEITFDDIDVTQNITDFIKLDNVPVNATNLSGAVETYAIDPTLFTFTTATVTALAKGNMLYKCKNWDFANQNCTDNNWTFMQVVAPDQQYSFTLTPEDPAYTVTIQDLGVTNDSYVDQANSGTNYGTATTVYVQSRSSSRNMRTFEFFNLSSIPSNAIITSANLSLYKTGGTGSSTRTYNLYRVTASWTETGITWTNQPAVAGTVTSTASVATGTNNVWKTWDATSDVQAFVNGTYSNYGWRISDSSESSLTQYASNFASEENANTTIRPKLDIAYKVPPTTPTSITCNGGSCNNTFYQTVGLNCSGSTAGNETITYVIDAYYNQSSGSAGSTNVSTSCRTDTYTTGQNYEFYSKWTIPGSGNVTLTNFNFYDYDGTLSGSENIQMALYADGGSYNRLSEIVTITGAGAIGWVSGTLATPITITLGQTYWIAVGPSGSPSYSLARDAGADCSGYPPTGTGSYYQSVSGGLDSAVPTGASQSANKYIIPGITYTSAYAYTWSTIGNHTNGSSYNWNISGIMPQSNVDLRCNATDSTGAYSNYYTGGFNLTISSAPLADTTPPTTTLTSPANGNVTTSNNVTFNCSATDNIQLKNITFYWNYTGNFIANGTDTITGTSNSTTISRTNLSNGNYKWNCYACDNSSNCAFAASNYTVTVNYTAPDTLAPTYSSDSDNSSGSVTDNKIVAVSTYWQDNYQLSTATFRNNASGSWANVSNCSLSGTSSWCNTTINASGYAGKTICWNQYANDTSNNWNTTMPQTAHCFNVISSDTTPPTVTINSPANNSLDGDGSVLFNCSATDNIALANISLYLNAVLNQTNPVTGTSNSTTFSKTLANGNYNWYCRASDAAGNANNSATYSLQVNTAAVPVSTQYSGNTTNWAALPDLTNVCNGAAVLEIPSYGQIQWYGCVNAASQNFNTYVNITNNFISVDFGLNPTFNSSAQLKLRGLNWSDTEDFNILINGEICGNTTCQNVTYENTTGTVTFDVGHFTNFSTSGTSTLLIWDQNDTGMPGGNRPACIGSSIDFYAYYYRTVLGFNLTNTGATCIINFTDSTGNSMTYNATSNYYAYARTFSSTGLKAYNVSCVKTTVPTRPYIAVADSINITDCAPPQWSNNQSSYPAKYNASQPSIFNITWTDNTNVSTVKIEGNWSGVPTNYSMNLISGNTANGIWNYSTILAAGTYYWKSYANDTSNSWNSTSSFVFTIAKADNPANLYLNGNLNQNVTITYPTQSNATGTALVGTPSLFRDGAPVGNPEIITLAAKPAGYNYTVSTTGNANYSANSTTYYLFVSKQSTNVDLYINGNLNQNVTITYGTPSNVTAIGYNGTVTLYRNGTSVGTSELATLGASYYNYTASIPDDANHTGSSRTYFLNVTPAASTVQLLLDGASANKTIEVGGTVNLTANLTTPSTGIVQLYRNGSLINSGNAPITNLSAFNTLGAFNITAIYPATQNYSTSSQTYYVITQDTTPPNVYLTSPGNNTKVASHTQSFVFNATDNYYTTLNCTLYINNLASGVNASVVNNTATTITNTTIPEGNDPWYVNCTDGSSNTGKSETRILTVDLTPPTIVHIRPVQNDILGYTVTLEVNATDNLVGVNSVWYQIRNTTGIVKSGTMSGTAPVYTDIWDTTTVSEGPYNFTAYANDTLGNQANSTVSFTIDNTPPMIQIFTPLNNSPWNSNFNLNVTIQNSLLAASSYNITNSTGYVLQSNFNNSINQPTFNWTDLVNVTNLPSGTYNLTVYARNNVGYPATESVLFIVDKAPPQYSNLTVSPASPTNYSPTQFYQFNATWTDNVAMGAVIFEFNGTNYTISVPSGSVYSKNFTGLNFGTYNYRWYANDTAGNLNSTGTFTYTVNKAATNTSLYLNGARSNLAVTYPTQTNATAVTSAGSVTLYRNGTNVSTSEIATLAAGYYNYTAINTGDSNYLPSSETWFLTVNVFQTYVNLSLNGVENNIAITYPQTLTAVFSTNSLSATMYRNGSNINSENNTAISLAAGYYNYTVINPGDANHTASSKTFFATVNKQATAVDLFLNGSQNNLTIAYGTQSNVTAIGYNGTVTLYRNGTNVGTSEIATLGAGYYNYTAIIPGDVNKTGSSKTFFLTVNKATPTLNLLLDGAAADKSVTYPTQTNATASESNTGDSDVTYTLYRNSNIVGSGSLVSDVVTLSVGAYAYAYNTTGGANYTSNTINRTLTVGKQTTAVDLFLNGAQNNLTITYGAQSNATAIGYNGTVTLYRNGTNVGTSDNTTLAAGYYNYTASIPDDVNKTGSSKTFFLTVNKAAGNITLLLNGTNNDFNVNRSQAVNITGIRTAGESNMQLYDSGVLINSGAPVIANITSYSALGPRNITLVLNETQNYTAATATHSLTVYGILSAFVTAPTGTPKYYEGQNITFKGYVRDELSNSIDSATVTFEPINGSFVYVCSSSLGEGSGVYNCTLDTTGMASPRIYNVRINASKSYYYTGTYTNSSIFLLESGQKANLILHKIPSVQAINSSQITYNVTLYLANGRGTSENTILTDPDASQTWNESTIFGAQQVTQSYLLTYNRGSTDSQITLQKANVTGFDPFYNISLFTESNQPTIVIPQNITGAQLTLIKNLVFVNQTTTNITYTITDVIVNSGGSDLTNIAIVDSDIGLTTTANLTRGNSATYSGNKTITKNSQSYTYNFTQTSAFANSQFFYSNQPAIQIPGYGGPYDVIITDLPASVTTGSTITGTIKAINMNSEISEDRTLTTWIEDQFGNITALDVRTIFIGRNQSAITNVTLTVPSVTGTYHFVAELAWPTATANASKAFDVTSAVVPPVPPAPAPGPAVAPPMNITLPPGVPQDIINSLIELRNTYSTLNREIQDLNMMIQMAEDAAAKGDYDLARNLINTAYGEITEMQLQLCGKITCGPKAGGITLPSVQFTWPKLPQLLKLPQLNIAKWWIWILLSAATAIFIIAFIVWRSEEMALEAELLREERTHLEKLYDKVGDYLNRKITKGDKNNEI